MLGVAVTALMLGLVPGAYATPLNPGGSVLPNAIPMLPAGTLVGTQTTNINVPGAFTATVIAAVWKENSGNMDFVYQVLNTSGPKGETINAFQTASYAGFTTNVSNLNSADAGPGGQLHGVGFNLALNPNDSNLAKRPGTFQPATLQNSKTVIFTGSDFTIAPGEHSTLLVVGTNGHTWSNKGHGLVVGEVFAGQLNTYAPAAGGGIAGVPEPTSLVLLGGCVLGLGARAGWRRWRRKPSAQPAV
jgi:hypothetical protein